MKKIIASLLTVLFLAAVSGPVLADEAKPVKTPVTKSMKHKKMGHKAKKKAVKKMKTSTTPTAK